MGTGDPGQRWGCGRRRLGTRSRGAGAGAAGADRALAAGPAWRCGRAGPRLLRRRGHLGPRGAACGPERKDAQVNSKPATGSKEGESAHEELARAVKEEDAMPASAKEARVKQFRKLKQQIRELQMRHRSLEVELYRREWSHRACLREKDALIRKYKQQLFLAAEREWILEERNKMQAERDWQQLCENAESDWYQKSENMTRSPSSAREQVGADRQKTDHRLHEVKTQRSALPVEREQTTQASFDRCVLPEGDKQCDYKSFLNKDVPALEIRKLREQNANLRAAVAQMRKEMESLDEQTSSVPPAATAEHAERGSLCTNDISAGASIKVSSTNLDCIVSPDTEKGPNPKVLGGNVANLNQQSPDADPGVGPQCGVSCTLRGMQNTLKEAARKISILSQEKQQLIEMGNRLRAELGMLLKEGLWHPVSSEHCTVCTASGSLFPRELVKRTQCQLSALKHLQHRLTTQELQYAKRLCPSRIPSLIAWPGLKGEPAPSSRGREAASPSAEVQLDFSIENHWPEQQKADTSSTIFPSQPLRPSPRPAQQVQLSSPRAHNFCQGIWQTLETGSSLPAFSPQKNTAQVECEVLCSTEQSEESQQNIKAKDELEVPGSDLAVRGTRLEVQQKLKSRNSSCPHPIKPKIPSNITKIRNYNIKD